MWQVLNRYKKATPEGFSLYLSQDDSIMANYKSINLPSYAEFLFCFYLLYFYLSMP